jgi:hypothetical protein
MAFDTVQADVSANVKAKLLNCIPNKQSETANLAKHVELAVGMKYDIHTYLFIIKHNPYNAWCRSFLYSKINEFNFTRGSIGDSVGHQFLMSKELFKLGTKHMREHNSHYDLLLQRLHKSQGDTMNDVVVSLLSLFKS